MNLLKNVIGKLRTVCTRDNFYWLLLMLIIILLTNYMMNHNVSTLLISPFLKPPGLQ